MSETVLHDVTKYEIAPGVVFFDGKRLGSTDGPVQLTVTPEYRESTCNQAGKKVLAKYIVNYKIEVKAKFKEIDTALTTALGTAGKLTAADFATNLIDTTKAKPLIIVSTNRDIKLPNACLEGAWDYPLDGENETGITLTFGGYEDATGTFLEKITPSSGTPASA